ncbi:MAG: MBL fold metallo-hydrolase [Syntrophales bacterium]
MRFRKTGKIADHLWYFGREEAGVYLIEGRDSSIIINGGISYILPDVLRQMEEFRIDKEKIGKLLILHSHFDHVGIVPYFKRSWPKIEVCASGPAWDIFSMPKAVGIMNSFSGLCARKAGAEDALKSYDAEWRDDIAGTVVSGGDKIDLGGITLSIVGTPGHTNCSITAYEPQMKALFASDAVGIPFKDHVFPSMNTNMTQYVESLERLKPLKVDYICADHYGYVTGEEAGRFIDMTIAEAQRWRTYMEDLYRKNGGEIEAATKAITAGFFEQMPDYFIQADILEGVFKQMVKYISKNIQP